METGVCWKNSGHQPRPQGHGTEECVCIVLGRVFAGRENSSALTLVGILAVTRKARHGVSTCGTETAASARHQEVGLVGFGVTHQALMILKPWQATRCASYHLRMCEVEHLPGPGELAGLQESLCEGLHWTDHLGNLKMNSRWAAQRTKRSLQLSLRDTSL